MALIVILTALATAATGVWAAYEIVTPVTSTSPPQYSRTSATRRFHPEPLQYINERFGLPTAALVPVAFLMIVKVAQLIVHLSGATAT